MSPEAIEILKDLSKQVSRVEYFETDAAKATEKLANALGCLISVLLVEAKADAQT